VRSSQPATIIYLLQLTRAQARSYGFDPERSLFLEEPKSKVYSSSPLHGRPKLISVKGQFTVEDKTISRQHLTIEVDPVGSEDCVGFPF